MENHFAIGMTILIVLYLACQYILFTRMVKQNSDLLHNADKRLAQANEMVLILAKTSAEVADNMKEVKELIIHLESVYNSRLDCVTKNRDEIMSAYTKLLAKFEDLRMKHESMMDDSYSTMKELARRPTLTNNNNTQ